MFLGGCALTSSQLSKRPDIAHKKRPSLFLALGLRHFSSLLHRILLHSLISSTIWCCVLTSLKDHDVIVLIRVISGQFCFYSSHIAKVTMSGASHDPRLLYSVNNIRAFHIQDGEEQELTPSGPQTLSLLMVPTATSAPTPPYAAGASTEPEEDFYLHLYLPPELDLALPATTQIFHQPPDSYLIPRWDMAPDVGAFIRIQFPSIGSGPDKVIQDDIDTFETILAQCTAFHDRAASSGKSDGHAAYNPADYAPGEGYVTSPDTKRADLHGKIVLVDEEDGSVVGELGDGYNVVEDADVKPGSKREHAPDGPTSCSAAKHIYSSRPRGN